MGSRSAPSSASWSASRASSRSNRSSRSRPSSPSRPSRPRRRRRPLVCIAGLACASKVEVRTVLSVCAKRRFARRYVLQGLSLWDVYVVRRISCARVLPSVPLVGAPRRRVGTRCPLPVHCTSACTLHPLCALGSRAELFLPYCAAREDSACVFLLLLSLWC